MITKNKETHNLTDEEILKISLLLVINNLKAKFGLTDIEINKIKKIINFLTIKNMETILSSNINQFEDLIGKVKNIEDSKIKEKPINKITERFYDSGNVIDAQKQSDFKDMKNKIVKNVRSIINKNYNSKTNLSNNREKPKINDIANFLSEKLEENKENKSKTSNTPPAKKKKDLNKKVTAGIKKGADTNKPKEVSKASNNKSKNESKDVKTIKKDKTNKLDNKAETNNNQKKDKGIDHKDLKTTKEEKNNSDTSKTSNTNQKKVDDKTITLNTKKDKRTELVEFYKSQIKKFYRLDDKTINMVVSGREFYNNIIEKDDTKSSRISDEEVKKHVKFEIQNFVLSKSSGYTTNEIDKIVEYSLEGRIDLDKIEDKNYIEEKLKKNEKQLEQDKEEDEYGLNITDTEYSKQQVASLVKDCVQVILNYSPKERNNEKPTEKKESSFFQDLVAKQTGDTTEEHTI